MEPSFSPANGIRNAAESADVLLRQAEIMIRAATRHAERIGGTRKARLHQAVKEAQSLAETMV
ncbi:MAG: hypothetical protein L0Y57_10890, partial [Beijerinckiaceae bacterium]|nr:hypothetical protein [Beijerinckiaceae bacterium]